MIERPRCSKLLPSGRQCGADAEWLPKISRAKGVEDPLGPRLKLMMDVPVCTRHRSFDLDLWLGGGGTKTIEVVALASGITGANRQSDLRVSFVPIRGRDHPFEKYRA